MSEPNPSVDTETAPETETPAQLDSKAAAELIKSRQRAKEKARALEARAAELEARLAQFEQQEQAKEQSNLEAAGHYEKAKQAYEQRIMQLSEQIGAFKRAEAEREAAQRRGRMVDAIAGQLPTGLDRIVVEATLEKVAAAAGLDLAPDEVDDAAVAKAVSLLQQRVPSLFATGKAGGSPGVPGVPVKQPQVYKDAGAVRRLGAFRPK